MSLPPVSANVVVKTADSCNCSCFKKIKEEEQQSPPPKQSPSPENVTTTKHSVVETTEVKTYSKHRKEDGSG